MHRRTVDAKIHEAQLEAAAAMSALEHGNAGGSPVSFIGDIERLLERSAALSRMASLQERDLADRDSNISRLVAELGERAEQHEQDIQVERREVRLTEGEAAAWLLRGRDLAPRCEMIQKERAEFGAVEDSLSEHSEELAREVAEHPDRAEAQRQVRLSLESQLYQELKEAKSERQQFRDYEQGFRDRISKHREELGELETQSKSRARAQENLAKKMEAMRDTLASEKNRVQKLQSALDATKAQEKEAALTKKKIEELKHKNRRVHPPPPPPKPQHSSAAHDLKAKMQRLEDPKPKEDPKRHGSTMSTATLGEDLRNHGGGSMLVPNPGGRGTSGPNRGSSSRANSSQRANSGSPRPSNSRNNSPRPSKTDQKSPRAQHRDIKDMKSPRAGGSAVSTGGKASTHIKKDTAKSPRPSGATEG
eukprot:gnl/MRDRNA2_/MRDRNA2_97265_c0_seq1.p1 gnl/MRDRNA2_/MRDRNA2_97265_c0~~gnl/MRDRNA2_/MRDRNA2_97265_c0_seq1.p1  ORF type:complete len:421 (-),score=99.51 gnl/MRDRNA2_/MRDRNA2_97265_c0_seq1:27-1289(-)